MRGGSLVYWFNDLSGAGHIRALTVKSEGAPLSQRSTADTGRRRLDIDGRNRVVCLLDIGGISNIYCSRFDIKRRMS